MLKVKFIQIKNVVLAKILQQNEETRGKYELYTYSTTNGRIYTISSNKSPEIQIKSNNNMLYIKGDFSDLDDCISCHSFSNEKEAETFIQNMSTCINLYNQHNSSSVSESSLLEDDIKITIAE